MSTTKRLIRPPPRRPRPTRGPAPAPPPPPPPPLLGNAPPNHGPPARPPPPPPPPPSPRPRGLPSIQTRPHLAQRRDPPPPLPLQPPAVPPLPPRSPPPTLPPETSPGFSTRSLVLPLAFLRTIHPAPRGHASRGGPPPPPPPPYHSSHRPESPSAGDARAGDALARALADGMSRHALRRTLRRSHRSGPSSLLPGFPVGGLGFCGPSTPAATRSPPFPTPLLLAGAHPTSPSTPRAPLWPLMTMLGQTSVPGARGRAGRLADAWPAGSPASAANPCDAESSGSTRLAAATGSDRPARVRARRAVSRTPPTFGRL